MIVDGIASMRLGETGVGSFRFGFVNAEWADHW